MQLQDNKLIKLCSGTQLEQGNTTDQTSHGMKENQHGEKKYK
jgi:hypothetical protein